MTPTVYYPVLGCAACDYQEASAYQNRWLIVDEQGGLLSGQASLALQHVSVSIKLGYLVLRAPGMLRMDIPLDVIEDDDSVRRSLQIDGKMTDVVDEGDIAAVWFGHVAGTRCRLVKVHPDAQPLVLSVLQ